MEYSAKRCGGRRFHIVYEMYIRGQVNLDSDSLHHPRNTPHSCQAWAIAPRKIADCGLGSSGDEGLSSRLCLPPRPMHGEDIATLG